MTDVQDVNSAAEPSMEEILASIRRIIADEKEPESAVEAVAPPPEEESEDVLELTQMVQEDGSVEAVEEEAPVEAAAPEPDPEPVEIAPEPDPEPVVEPAPPPPPPMAKEEADALLSDMAESAAASSLAALASTVNIEKKAAFAGFTPLGNGGKTLEDIVMELMKPMLKEWLDQNLPPVVEKIVQKEVERIARRVQE
ncbi:MAG: DUF2497 domain-containing protein [Bdellovibrionales bacterium]